MNAMASECSSGCESGWTLYLEHSFLNHNASHRGTQFNGETDGFYEEHKEEEDLSMVSDASSGPPHFPDEEENGGFYSASKAVKLAKSGATKRQKDKENQHHKNDQHHLPSFLHDTASSCVFDFSTDDVAGNNRQTSTESMLDYSQGQGFSANYFKGRSSFHQHNDFLQSSLSENKLQGNKWHGRKEIGMR